MVIRFVLPAIATDAAGTLDGGRHRLRDRPSAPGVGPGLHDRPDRHQVRPDLASDVGATLVGSQNFLKASEPVVEAKPPETGTGIRAPATEILEAVPPATLAAMVTVVLVAVAVSELLRSGHTTAYYRAVRPAPTHDPTSEPDLDQACGERVGTARSHSSWLVASQDASQGWSTYSLIARIVAVDSEKPIR